jgi:DNA-binding transcriptional regulator YiaG
MGKPWKKPAARYMVTTGRSAYNHRLYNLGLFCQGDKRINTTSEWAQHVEALRNKLGETQVEFSKRFNVTQPAVSAWEKGSKEPSAENYIRMANMAGGAECYWFLKRAGVDLDHLKHLLSEELRASKKQ